MKEIQLPEFKMAYSDQGEGRPLVLVHGYPLNRKLWRRQVDGLQDAARVLAPDLRGHGDSGATPGVYTMDLLADDLKAFLDGVGITQPVTLCGLSMGGYVTFAFYRRYPERVENLILTATRAAADTPEVKANRSQAMQRARLEGIEAIIDGMLPRLVTAQTAARHPELVDELRAIMRHTSLEAVLGDLEGMRERADSTSTLEQIRVPTLVIHGAQDVIVPLAEAQAMQAAIPGAQLVVIENAGHLPNLEQTEAFNRAIQDFIE